MTLETESRENNSIPHELITEILSWLPVEPLLRFKTVCKLWLDTIQGLYFTHLHMMRYASTHPDTIWEEDTEGPDSNNNIESFTNVGYVNGLQLERCKSTNTYRLRNHSTKHVLHLPSPTHIETTIITIRFVSRTNEYKLLSHRLDKTTNRSRFEALTIGTDSTWRPLDIPNDSCYAMDDKVRGLCIDDVLYIFGLSKEGELGIICVDMVTEQFADITIPSCLFPDWQNVRALRWYTKFSIINVVQEQLHVWILEDYKKRKWADQKMVIPLTSILKDFPRFREHGSLCTVVGNGLVFLDNGKNLFMYDIKSGKVRCILSAPLGKKICFAYRPSMVYFRGMQPE